MRPDARGRFLVLDGPDGAGKSTQAALLVERLRGAETETVHLRDPGSTPLAEAVRRLLLGREIGDLEAMTEALLFMACRQELVVRRLLPALAEGRWVVCERFVTSTLVYQGHARGLDVALLEDFSRRALGGLEPDRVVLLDLDPEVALARAAARRTSDRIESRGLDYQRSVREGFLDLARRRPDLYRVVAAEGDPEEVAARVLVQCAGCLPARLEGADA